MKTIAKSDIKAKTNTKRMTIKTCTTKMKLVGLAVATFGSVAARTAEEV